MGALLDFCSAAWRVRVSGVAAAVLALALAGPAWGQMYQVSVESVERTAFEGGHAEFRLRARGGGPMPPNSSIFVYVRLGGSGGLSLADDLAGTQAIRVFTITTGQHVARFRIARDNLRELGEGLVLRITDVLAFGGIEAELAGTNTAADVGIRDTFDVSFIARETSPGSGFTRNITEGTPAEFYFTIGNGLTNHGVLNFDYEIADINGWRASDFGGTHLSSHSRSGTLIPIPSRSQGGDDWTGEVATAIRTSDTAVFTLTIPTADDNEPENGEQLCVQVSNPRPRDPFAGNGSNHFRLNLVTTGRVCTTVIDNDGKLRARFFAPFPGEVGEGGQVTYPIIFDAPAYSPAVQFLRDGQIHPNAVTYFHYAITGTATRGVDYAVQAAVDSAFNQATGRGYLSSKSSSKSSSSKSFSRMRRSTSAFATRITSKTPPTNMTAAPNKYAKTMLSMSTTPTMNMMASRMAPMMMWCMSVHQKHQRRAFRPHLAA